MIAVVAEYLMCDLFDKGNNVKPRMTYEMIFDGIKGDKDMIQFCQDFITL